MDYNGRVVLEFAKFLRKNKCLERFCYNFLEYHKNNIIESIGEGTLDDVCVSDKAKIVLGVIEGIVRRLNSSPNKIFWSSKTAFDWASTNEGIDYWADISIAWETYWYKELESKLHREYEELK